MKKSDLKIGYLVEVRDGIDGDFGIIMPTTNNREPNICRYNSIGMSNLEDYNEDLICERRSRFDIIRVWGYASTFKALTLEIDSRQLLWERKERIERNLTEHEVEILKALQTLGYEWLARDSNEGLFAYGKKPEKINMFWTADITVTMRIDEDLFSFIKWSDYEPTNIKELENNE